MLNPTKVTLVVFTVASPSYLISKLAYIIAQEKLVILHTIPGVDVFANIRDIGEQTVAGFLDQHPVAMASKLYLVFGDT